MKRLSRIIVTPDIACHALLVPAEASFHDGSARAVTDSGINGCRNLEKYGRFAIQM